jgi:hypothetical protein
MKLLKVFIFLLLAVLLAIMLLIFIATSVPATKTYESGNKLIMNTPEGFYRDPFNFIHDLLGVDELHIIYTDFSSIINAVPGLKDVPTSCADAETQNLDCRVFKSKNGLEFIVTAPTDRNTIFMLTAQFSAQNYFTAGVVSKSGFVNKQTLIQNIIDNIEYK